MYMRAWLADDAALFCTALVFAHCRDAGSLPTAIAVQTDVRRLKTRIKHMM